MPQYIEDVLKEAEVLRIQGRWEDALVLLREHQTHDADHDDMTLARIWLAIGRVLTEQAMFGNVDTLEAREEAFDKALALAEPHSDPKVLGSIWDAKGFSLHAAYLRGDRQREPEHELEYFERALTLRQQVPQTDALAESLFHVGLVYGVVRDDHAQALPYFEESYRLAKESNDAVMASYAVRHIAFALYDAGEMGDAHAALEESLRLREEAGFVPGVAMALLMLARLETEQGNTANAVKRLERARDIFETLHAPQHLERVTRQIAELTQD